MDIIESAMILRTRWIGWWLSIRTVLMLFLSFLVSFLEFSDNFFRSRVDLRCVQIIWCEHLLIKCTNKWIPLSSFTEATWIHKCSSRSIPRSISANVWVSHAGIGINWVIIIEAILLQRIGWIGERFRSPRGLLFNGFSYLFEMFSRVTFLSMSSQVTHY